MSPTKSKPSSGPTPRHIEIYRSVAAKGMSRAEAAQKFNVKPATVVRAERRVRRFLSKQIQVMESVLTGQLYLDRLEFQWSELMEAWQRSKGEQLATKVATDPDGKKRAEVTRRFCPGDVRYLEQARRVLNDMCALLKLKQIIEGKDAISDVQLATLEQRYTQLNQMLDAYGEQGSDHPHDGTDLRLPDPAGPVADGPLDDAA